MGSSTPFSFSLNFTELLNSQQERNDPESLPSFSPPIQISSSPIPQYNTQSSDVQYLGENSRDTRYRWAAVEDVVLISAWLNTSKDPIVSNGQKAATFWDRVATYYGESEEVAGKPKRGASQCKQRWKKINESVNKFVGCYDQASRRRSSGQSDDDVLQMANELYVNDQKKKFYLEHAWSVLRYEQKWCTLVPSRGNKNSKRTKLDASGTYSSSSNTTSRVEENVCQRPPGAKASKGKAKRSVHSEGSEVSSLEKLQKAWEIREKEIAARERISKQRLLESLIGRTDMSEAEINLRKKLVDEMLG